MTHADFVQPLIDAIADGVAERLLRAQSRMVSQSQSELGPRRHREAVQRRIEQGEGGAFRRGRKHLLTQAAYHEELARGSAAASATGRRKTAPTEPAKTEPENTGADDQAPADFERQLLAGLRRVGR